jgi:hypothetical protein
MMMKDRKYNSEEDAYKSLLSDYWNVAPGRLPAIHEENFRSVQTYLKQEDASSNAAVAIGFAASDELLLAGNLLADGQVDDGWAWMDRSQAYAHWQYEIDTVSVWVPSVYSRAIFGFHDFCAYFALALARGNESSVRWYAQQLYNLCRGGVADDSCAAREYVNLHWEMAIAVLRGRWSKEEDLSPDLGVYRDLFLSVGDRQKQTEAVVACARYHLDLAAYTAPKNDEQAAHPYRTRSVGHIAYELLGWSALHKRLSGECDLEGSHPMLFAGLLNPPPQRAYSDDLLAGLQMKALKQYGEGWDNSEAPDFDVVWPDG